MRRIVRLTESDLTRIVRRVISESSSKLGNDMKLGGKTYYALRFGDNSIGYVDTTIPGTAIKDANIIATLNKSTGYNIPTSNGILSVGYIQKNPGFKTNLRNLI
jgi:hypothetical protein